MNGLFVHHLNLNILAYPGSSGRVAGQFLSLEGKIHTYLWNSYNIENLIKTIIKAFSSDIQFDERMLQECCRIRDYAYSSWTTWCSVSYFMFCIIATFYESWECPNNGLKSRGSQPRSNHWFWFEIEIFKSRDRQLRPIDWKPNTNGSPGSQTHHSSKELFTLSWTFATSGGGNLLCTAGI